MNEATEDFGFLSLAEVSERLVLDPRTVLAFVQSRELRAVRLGRQWRIRVTDLETFLERKYAQTEAELDTAGIEDLPVD